MIRLAEDAPSVEEAGQASVDKTSRKRRLGGVPAARTVRAEVPAHPSVDEIGPSINRARGRLNDRCPADRDRGWS